MISVAARSTAASVVRRWSPARAVASAEFAPPIRWCSSDVKETVKETEEKEFKWHNAANRYHLKIFRADEAAVSTAQANNVHLSPTTFWEEVQKTPASSVEGSKFLKVCVLGVPNAGKSTLINALCGFSVCPYSQRVHTTRKAVKAILTDSSTQTQVVFSDTPGLVTKEAVKKFKLDPQLVGDPELALKGADLLLVVQDVSNRYVREAIDKNILRLLCQYHRTPSVLVLNKLDTIPQSRRVFDLIRKLTCNHLEGKEAVVRVVKKQSKHTADSYLRAKEAIAPPEEKSDKLDSRAFLQVLESATSRLEDDKVSELLRGVVGWPGFRDVFAVSASSGQGIDVLKQYVLASAKSASWAYSDQVRSCEDPRDFVLATVKAKLLEVLPGDIPYSLKPRINSWQVEEGLLRIGITIDSHHSRFSSALLSQGAANIKKVSTLSETDLQNFFQCTVFVTIGVETLHKLSAKARDVLKREDTTADVFL